MSVCPSVCPSDQCSHRLLAMDSHPSCYQDVDIEQNKMRQFYQKYLNLLEIYCFINSLVTLLVYWYITTCMIYNLHK